MSDKCPICGRGKKPEFETCYICFDAFTNTPEKLFENYLKDGYFKVLQSSETDKSQRRVLLKEIFTTEAEKAANILHLTISTKTVKLTKRGMRKYYNKLMALVKSSEYQSFEEIEPNIAAFQRDVVYNVGREVVPPVFLEFIRKNIPLAIKDAESLYAFKEHFESVLAYFTYHRKDDKE